MQNSHNAVLRTIVDNTGMRRVLIIRRSDGLFRFEVEHWSDEPKELCWIPRGGRSVSLCDSEEIALREAIGRVDWLQELLGA